MKTRSSARCVRAARAASRVGRVARAIILALATPLLEKNSDKIRTAPWFVPMVFSMARVIVLGFALVMWHQVEKAGVAGWPEATLSMAIVLALPILNALERARVSQVLGLARSILGRFGEGATRSMGGMFNREPSKYDDHRADDHGEYDHWHDVRGRPEPHDGSSPDDIEFERVR